MEPRIKVRLFGSLCITKQMDTGEEKTLGEEEFHSPSLVRLLAYILQNHGKVISSQELIEVLWPEEEGENPLGTLKNLVYRLRTILKKLDKDMDFILTGKKAYFWNPDLPVEIDTEIFDKNYREGQVGDRETKKTCYEKAIHVYPGAFLGRHEEIYWVLSTKVTYESSYNSMVSELCRILLEDKEYERAEDIANQALKQDNLSEENHAWLIRALIGQNKMKLALDHYHTAEELLYENLDIEVTEQLQSIWPLLMEQTQSKEKNIKKIQKELMDDYRQGAFFCEYGTFKKIYQLELRRADRMGISVFMSLLTIGFVPLKKTAPERRNHLILEAMDNMKEVLLTCLRSGDVITRYSKSQFIVLLPTCQYETARKVMSRIEAAYYNRYGKTDVKLEYSFDAI